MEKERTKTLDVIAAANGRETIVAGEVAELDFPKTGGMSLLSSKLLVQILDLAGPSICEPKQHRVQISELNWSHRDLATIEDSVIELQRTLVRLRVETGKGIKRKSGQILTDVSRDEDAASGELVWKFSDTFRQVVRHSRHWAAISLSAVLAFECKYSVWLYQLAALHAPRRQVTKDWSLDELRERLGAKAPSLKRWPDFRNRVLEPAVAEVNHLTGVMVSWEPIKPSRKVTGIKLSCRLKTDEELEDAQHELGKSRPGRKARRDDTVERIVKATVEQRRWLAESLEKQTKPPGSDLDDSIEF